jgi:hypothetical protein
MTMTNRHDRRAEAARLRKLRARNPGAKAAEALIAELQEGNEALQRHNTVLEYAVRAAQIASQIKVIEPTPDHESIEGDPNWERSKLIAEAEQKAEIGRANLAAAYLDMCDLFAKFDEPVSDLTIVPANAVPQLRVR